MVNKHNDLTVKVLGEDYHEYLNRFFDKPQMGMIEAAFEVKRNCKSSDWCTEQELNEAVDFGESIGMWQDSAEARLVAILNNIIENKGEFIPCLLG